MAKNQNKHAKLRTPRWLKIEQLFVRRRQKSLYGSLMMGRSSQDLAPQVIYFTGWLWCRSYNNIRELCSSLGLPTYWYRGNWMVCMSSVESAFKYDSVDK